MEQILQLYRMMIFSVLLFCFCNANKCTIYFKQDNIKDFLDKERINNMKQFSHIIVCSHASYYDQLYEGQNRQNINKCFQTLEEEQSVQDDSSDDSEWYANQNGFVKKANQANFNCLQECTNHRQQQQQQQSSKYKNKHDQTYHQSSSTNVLNYPKTMSKIKPKSLSSPANQVSFNAKLLNKKHPQKNSHNKHLKQIQKTQSITTSKSKHKSKNTLPKKKRKQKQKNTLQKSGVTYKSHKSSQFLVLGEDIYDYQEMNKIPNKGYKNSYQNQNSNKRQEGTAVRNKNNHGSNRESKLAQQTFFSYSRFSKKLSLAVNKIQKYFLGFLQFQDFQNSQIRALDSERIHQLPTQQKLQLYHTLLQDEKLREQLQNQIKYKQENQIKQILELAVEQIDKKCQKMVLQYSGETKLIIKWKNSKMHQLETAKVFLIATVKEANSSKDDLIQQSQNSSPLDILQKQLQIILSEDFYPQLRQQTILLKESLLKHFSNDSYPEHFQHEAQVSHRLVKVQQTQNYFTPNGVLYFFEKLTQFLESNQKFLEQIIRRGNFAYGMSSQAKKMLSKIEIDNWYDFMEVQLNTQPIISEQIFVDFQRSVIGIGQTQSEKQNRPYMHIFNKAITDSINQEFQKFQPFYPCGEPLSYLQKTPKFLQFVPQTFQFIFQKCKYSVYSNSIIMLAGLIVDPEQYNDQIKKYNYQKIEQIMKLDLKQNNDKYHSVLPVAKLVVLDELIDQIYDQLFEESVWQIGNIDQK